MRRELKIQCELSDAANLLFLITFADDQSTIAKLIAALKNLPHRPKKFLPPATAPQEISVAEVSPRETFYASTVAVALTEAVDKICAEEITFYPPGIPLVMPGEKISAQTVELIRREKFSGSRVIGASDPTLTTVKVVN